MDIKALYKNTIILLVISSILLTGLLTTSCNRNKIENELERDVQEIIIQIKNVQSILPFLNIMYAKQCPKEEYKKNIATAMEVIENGNIKIQTIIDNSTDPDLKNISSKFKDLYTELEELTSLLEDTIFNDRTIDYGKFFLPCTRIYSEFYENVVILEKFTLENKLNIKLQQKVNELAKEIKEDVDILNRKSK